MKIIDRPLAMWMILAAGLWALLPTVGSAGVTVDNQFWQYDWSHFDPVRVSKNADLIRNGSAALESATYTGNWGLPPHTPDMLYQPPKMTDGLLLNYGPPDVESQFRGAAAYFAYGYNGALMDGSFNIYDRSGYVPPTATYVLDTTTNTLGYDIVEIRSFAGYYDIEDYTNQYYEVWYSKVDSPGTFNYLTTVNNQPFNTQNVPSPSTATYSSITNDADFSLTGVKALKFVFLDNGGWNGKVMNEIDARGFATRVNDLPKPGTLEGLGMTQHLADPENSELDLIEQGGWSMVRMVMNWNKVETTQGQYNFDYGGQWPVGVLHERWTLDRGKRSLFILDDVGTNALYGARWSQTWQDGFVNFAAAAVAKYAGGSNIYEIMNEPFNDPIDQGPNAVTPAQYVAFVGRVADAMRSQDPGVKIVGPAVSPVYAPEYLKAWFSEGLLDKVDAISLHPYTYQGAPEQIVSMYADVRNWMQNYGGKVIPIMSSEAGWYTGTAALAVSEQTQADYLARYHLINLSQDISGSVQYSFRNGYSGNGYDPSNPEHNYGVMKADVATPVLSDAKLAYAAMQLLTYSLSGKEFSTKLDDGFATDWLLLFENTNGDETLAAWTTQVGGRTVNLPGWGPLHLTSTPMYLNSVGVLGDYNGNGQVDAADYVVWRGMLGQTGAGLAADGDGNGAVNQLDYSFWRERFGNIAGAGAGVGSSVSVPEPLGLTLAIIGLSMLGATGRHRTRRA